MGSIDPPPCEVHSPHLDLPLKTDRKYPVVSCNSVAPPDCALCEHFLAQYAGLNLK